LLSFNSKSSYFDKNEELNLNLVLIYGEARGHSELPRQIYSETFVNVVQHLHGHQREDRILVAEEKILHEIENQP
jgi:hypothetical protein